MDRLELAADVTCVVGEAPTWSTREQALYWIDGQSHSIMRLRFPDRVLETRPLPYRPSCLALLPERGLVVGYKKGLGTFDFDSGEAVALPLTGVPFEAASFNDGACDAAGRLWIGTRHRDASEPVCALFCIEPGLKVRRMVDGIIVSNGIAFSPDGQIMYHTDSRPGRIDAYDYDVAHGTLSNDRRRAGRALPARRNARPHGYAAGQQARERRLRWRGYAHPVHHHDQLRSGRGGAPDAALGGQVAQPAHRRGRVA
jgi:sugar lactone lactonase YvrE